MATSKAPKRQTLGLAFFDELPNPGVWPGLPFQNGTLLSRLSEVAGAFAVRPIFRASGHEVEGPLFEVATAKDSNPKIDPSTPSRGCTNRNN
jgi:hypothetical protein